MSGIWWYVAGVFTLPVMAYIGAGVLWAFNKNLGTECGNCGKVLGRNGVDPQLGTELRWKAHYLRYWYLTRPNWTCKRSEP